MVRRFSGRVWTPRSAPSLSLLRRTNGGLNQGEGSPKARRNLEPPNPVVAFRNLRTDSCMNQIRQPGFKAEIFIYNLNRTSDHVYSDGKFNLWRRPCPYSGC